MLLKCKKISEPYKGPYSESLIITYYLYDSEGIEYRWHQGPNKELCCKVGDILDGIVIAKKKESNKNFKENVINYKKSNPIIINMQNILDI
jgi:hypothetical protein